MGAVELTDEVATHINRPPYAAWSKLTAAHIVAVMAVAIGLRVWHLDTLPGINGDEAWSGVQAERLLAGDEIEWRTPNGNFINPFYFVPLVALHAILPASFVLLRIVSLTSGLLALVVNYFLCRRAFDVRTALISTLILAVLPIDIAYSRFGWDSSQSLLATLFVLYLPLMNLRRSIAAPSVSIGGVAALACAVLIHPTNVFGAVLVVVPVGLARRRQLIEALENRRIQATTWRLPLLVLLSLATAYAAWSGLVHAAGRLNGPAELPAFAKNYLELFSGTTVYSFINGWSADAPGNMGWLGFVSNSVFAALAAWALWGMTRRIADDSGSLDRALVIGWLLMLAAFFVIAGPSALAPHRERYGICLIAPAVLVIARGLAWWLEGWHPCRRCATATLIVCAWVPLLAFYLGYFAFHDQYIMRAHRAFRTSDVEPKRQALDVILQARRDVGRTTIVCSDYWTYWPLAYLAAGNSDVKVVLWRKGLNGKPLERDARIWFVEFADQDEGGQVGDAPKHRAIVASRRTVVDSFGRPILYVYGPLEKSFQNY